MYEDVVARVRDVVSKAADLPAHDEAIPPDADLFQDLCVNSGVVLTILLSLEDEFGFAIPDEPFGNARSLRAIATLITELELQR